MAGDFCDTPFGGVFDFNGDGVEDFTEQMMGITALRYAVPDEDDEQDEPECGIFDEFGDRVDLDLIEYYDQLYDEYGNPLDRNWLRMALGCDDTPDRGELILRLIEVLRTGPVTRLIGVFREELFSRLLEALRRAMRRRLIEDLRVKRKRARGRSAGAGRERQRPRKNGAPAAPSPVRRHSDRRGGTEGKRAASAPRGGGPRRGLTFRRKKGILYHGDFSKGNRTV